MDAGRHCSYAVNVRTINIHYPLTFLLCASLSFSSSYFDHFSSNSYREHVPTLIYCVSIYKSSNRSDFRSHVRFTVNRLCFLDRQKPPFFCMRSIFRKLISFRRCAQKCTAPFEVRPLLSRLNSKRSRFALERCTSRVKCIHWFITDSARAHKSVLNDFHEPLRRINVSYVLQGDVQNKLSGTCSRTIDVIIWRFFFKQN